MWRISTVLYLIVSFVFVGVIIWIVKDFSYFRFRIAQPVQSIKSQLDPGEKKIRDVVDEIEKYPNATIWEFRNNPPNLVLDYPPNTDILFYTDDDPGKVVEFYSAKLVSDGWNLKDKGNLSDVQGASNNLWIVFRRDRMSFLLDTDYFSRDTSKNTNYRIRIENLDLYKHLPADF